MIIYGAFNFCFLLVRDNLDDLMALSLFNRLWLFLSSKNSI